MAMIGIFKSALAKEVGTTEQLLYTAPTGKASILLEVDVANVFGSGVQVDVYIRRSSVDYHIGKNWPVPEGASLKIVDGQKIVLESEDELYIKANQPAAVDVICSLTEDVNTLV